MPRTGKSLDTKQIGGYQRPGDGRVEDDCYWVWVSFWSDVIMSWN